MKDTVKTIGVIVAIISWFVGVFVISHKLGSHAFKKCAEAGGLLKRETNDEHDEDDILDDLGIEDPIDWDTVSDDIEIDIDDIPSKPWDEL